MPAHARPARHPLHVDAAVDADHQSVRARHPCPAAARRQPRGRQPPAGERRSASARVRPRRTLRSGALEIGNEPELYGSFGWYRTAERTRGPQDVRAAMTSRTSKTTSRPFSKSMPSVPLAGPEHRLADVCGRSLAISWPSSGGVKFATVHAYPLKHCVATNHVTIGELLANSSSDGLAANVAPLAAIAHAHHLPLRIDEINAISCGGERGVSDTYADRAVVAGRAVCACPRGRRRRQHPHAAAVEQPDVHGYPDKRRLGGVRAPRLLRDADVRPGNAARLASGADQRHVGGGAVELGHAGSRRPHDAWS